MMNTWFRYFLGTPQRFLLTAGAIGLVTVMICPGLLATAANRLMVEISPILGPAIQLGVTIAVIVFMLKAVFK